MRGAPLAVPGEISAFFLIPQVRKEKNLVRRHGAGFQKLPTGSVIPGCCLSVATRTRVLLCHPGEAESGPNIPPAQVSPEMEASKQDECLGSIERNRGFGSGLRKTQSPEGPGFASVYPSDVSPPYHDICYTDEPKSSRSPFSGQAGASGAPPPAARIENPTSEFTKQCGKHTKKPIPGGLLEIHERSRLNNQSGPEKRCGKEGSVPDGPVCGDRNRQAPVAESPAGRQTRPCVTSRQR
ncbi:hypothetical protein MG293_014278 [Ovis ammon polii]|uniref:Uncharacterized protein n=1 Tax=Ovis ammon polii TaxID=230172 RepID=A0AAD4U001_OVIAM|nr:hypothetical protein MG293_014278 [Ovis ammon polii]